MKSQMCANVRRVSIFQKETTKTFSQSVSRGVSDVTVSESSSKPRSPLFVFPAVVASRTSPSPHAAAASLPLADAQSTVCLPVLLLLIRESQGKATNDSRTGWPGPYFLLFL